MITHATDIYCRNTFYLKCVTKSSCKLKKHDKPPLIGNTSVNLPSNDGLITSPDDVLLRGGHEQLAKGHVLDDIDVDQAESLGICSLFLQTSKRIKHSFIVCEV